MRLTLVIARLVAAAVVVVGLAACSADDDPSSAQAPSSAPTSSASETSAVPDKPAAGPGVQYVAMGDSYSAAPGVPPADPADGCYRSGSNYASVLADAVPRLRLDDVTCSGATSQSLVEQQVPALGPGTDLVTIGIGGNDFGIFSRLIGGCLGLAGDDPDGSPCTDAVQGEAETLLPQLADAVGSTLDVVLDAAPEAEVVVVGYPSLLPASGSCADRIPLATGDYAVVRQVNAGLSQVLRSAARQRDLAFVDVARASRGHDICAGEPWINGAAVAADGTIPFHPFAVEQAAVARLLERYVPER